MGNFAKLVLVGVAAMALACGQRDATIQDDSFGGEGGGERGDDGVRVGGALFNVAFGGARPSQKHGPAAVGKSSDDWWNAVVVGFDNDHTEAGLLDASKKPTSITARLQNLGGSWGQAGKLALHDPMIESFDYPVNNQGGDSHVTLAHVPAGTYTLLVYGTSANPDYYGDYSVSSGATSYGHKRTASGAAAAAATKWTEGLHYVSFGSVRVGDDGEIELLIKPGGVVTDGSGRWFSDAYICGLQLVREETSRPFHGIPVDAGADSHSTDSGTDAPPDAPPDSGPSIDPACSPPVPASALSDDGTFESDGAACGAAWGSSAQLSSATTIERSAPSRCGAHSCRVCGKSIFDIGMRGPATPGVHRIYGWLHATSDAPAPYMCWATIDMYNANGVYIGGAGGNGIAPDGAWAQSIVQLNVPGGVADIDYRIRCEAVGDQEGCVLIDDVWAQ